MHRRREVAVSFESSCYALAHICIPTHSTSELLVECVFVLHSSEFVSHNAFGCPFNILKSKSLVELPRTAVARV